MQYDRCMRKEYLRVFECMMRLWRGFGTLNVNIWVGVYIYEREGRLGDHEDQWFLYKDVTSVSFSEIQQNNDKNKHPRYSRQ